MELCVENGVGSGTPEDADVDGHTEEEICGGLVIMTVKVHFILNTVASRSATDCREASEIMCPVPITRPSSALFILGSKRETPRSHEVRQSRSADQRPACIEVWISAFIKHLKHSDNLDL